MIEEVKYPKADGSVYRHVQKIIESFDLGLEEVRAIEVRPSQGLITLFIAKVDSKGAVVKDHLGQVKTVKRDFTY